MIRDPIGVKVRRGVDPMQWFMMVAAYGGSEEKRRKAIDQANEKIGDYEDFDTYQPIVDLLNPLNE